jgi:hypothetical protein
MTNFLSFFIGDNDLILSAIIFPYYSNVPSFFILHSFFNPAGDVSYEIYYSFEHDSL